ncbi:phosphotransferase [Pseudomonas sp. SZMC_28357]|uniref:phosphotransferase enzyme family protein n=1 Tax=Pseudomonas sp. SZMC_28357 TaxID=3074380 RepID=UPI002871FE15|nr:phosphotransferase [Pseudomonas sp. SZMC_28357]MDR9753380.1 phosphotransferase [Pseudomonas sp. SZMC_28357]
MTTAQQQELDVQTLRDVAVRTLARCYPPHVQGQVTLLCHSENATYRIDTPDGQRYALRVHKLGYHHTSEIENELVWLNALQASGIQVPRPIAGLDGHPVQQAPVGGGQKLNLVLFNWVSGTEPTADVDLSAFKRLGAITAKLHQHSREWQRPADFRRIIWNHRTMVGPQGHWGNWRAAANLDSHAVGLIEETLQRVERELARYGQEEQRYGLIHADLRLANLLVDQEQTHVIDFDDCGFGWYMHDLAAALSFYEHHERLNDWIEHWLAGYVTVAPLSAEDIAMIPTFIIQRRIQVLAWIGSHADTQQARSVGAGWVRQSVELCQRYLNGEFAKVAV